MSAGLAGDPNTMELILPVLRRILGGFAYTPDNHYRSFTQGDRVAPHGLTGLIAGGASGLRSAKNGLWRSTSGNFLSASLS